MITWRFIAEAKERGAKLITIDPSYPTIAAKSEAADPVIRGSYEVKGIRVSTSLVTSFVFAMQVARPPLDRDIPLI
ncbi:hypothetical protein AT727_05760 [Desulfitobacterium hafniense]|uniref:Uncharacterized protein n=1 Tax=Desulfitobacterium hafniense TaxID=49338 RepID=A0A0W1JHU7_DESHA|nr:hypothetical protein AT727_05760 [Desulfitobacterium hafniense]